jgi:hypothetical protein
VLEDAQPDGARLYDQIRDAGWLDGLRFQGLLN